MKHKDQLIVNELWSWLQRRKNDTSQERGTGCVNFISQSKISVDPNHQRLIKTISDWSTPANHISAPTDVAAFWYAQLRVVQ